MPEQLVERHHDIALCYAPRPTNEEGQSSAPPTRFVTEHAIRRESFGDVQDSASVDKTERVSVMIRPARCRYISQYQKFNMDLKVGQCLVDGSSQTVDHMVRRIPAYSTFIVRLLTNHGFFI